MRSGQRKLRIFIAHPSSLLTDRQGHGDGLVAFGFIRGLALRGHDIVIAAEDVDLSEPFPGHVTVHAVPLRSKNFVLRRLEFMFKMRRLYDRISRERRFDLIQQLNPVFPGLSLALIGADAPVVLGTYVPSWPAARGTRRTPTAVVKQLLKHAVEWAQQRSATGLILSSPAALERVIEKKASGDKIRFVSPGIDPAAFPTAIVRDGMAPKILFLSQISAKKGVFDVLEAFQNVVSSLPAAELQIAGDGRDLAEVRSRALAMTCANRISFLGHVPRERIVEVMQTCSVYCLPSYGEPFGLTILEAMAIGKPIVTTDVGGPRYIVTDDGGRRVRPGDVPAIARALLEILTTPEMPQRMGEANRQRIESTFSWERVVSELEAAYDLFLSAAPVNR